MDFLKNKKKMEEKLNKKEEEQNVETNEKTTQETDTQELNQDIENEETTKAAEAPEQTAEEKLQSLNDTYLRLMAEFDNYRKRTQRERVELIKYASEGVISSILPVIDNLERALANMENSTDIKAEREGIQLIYQQFLQILSQRGLKAIDTESGDFDTEYHEAITTIPAPKEELKGKILDCTLKGYMLGDKVIRHSKVVIGE